jgi:N-acetylneuraminic acid mutarotase
MTVSLAVPLLASGQSTPYAPVPQDSLRQMLSIDYHLGPDLPVGIQDAGIGIVNGNLVYAGGLNPPGTVFSRNTYGLSLVSPQDGWLKQSLPDFPSTVARQGLNYVTVNNQAYMWGGFNFTYPNCYSDGYRLSQTPQGQWAWSAMPALPWSSTCTAMSAIGSKIYAFGGGDVYPYQSDLRRWTNVSHDGSVQRPGSQLLMLDTNHLGAGWTQLAQCPGTPRMSAATGVVNGKLYVLGGNTGGDNQTGTNANVVDNWQYDPVMNSWQRLQDMPVACGAFSNAQTTFNDRYILMVGGYQYSEVMRSDGSIVPNYGTLSQHDPGDYYSDIFVYDALLGKFGTATMLPLNNCAPVTVIEGNTIHMIGNECDATVIDGRPYEHLPALYLAGTISVVPEPATSSMVITLVLLGALALVRGRRK